MKSRLLILLLAISAVLAGLIPRVARAQDEEVNFDFFYDSLSPYGDWVQVADYGLCWHPSNVAEDWAPYTDGYWAYTDGGWTWVSYEDFGSVVYHYGRWTNIESEGWCWVPEYEWGPAWVSWRNNDDYVGWAPLPPEARYERTVGISTWVDNSYDIGPGNYRFCHVRDFGSPVIREVCLPPRDNVVYIRDTSNVTNIVVSDGGFPFCGGPSFGFLSARVGRPIPALRLIRDTSFNDFDRRGGDRTKIVNNNTTIVNNNTTVINNYRGGLQQGNTLRFPAPRVRAESPAAVLNRVAVKPTRQFTATQVKRGWSAASAEDRQAIKAKFQADAKGATPETTKAVPVKAAEVAKVLPKKADPKAKSPVAALPTKAARPITSPNALPGNPANPTNPTSTAENPPVTGTPPAALPGKPGKGGKPGKPVPVAKVPSVTPPVAPTADGDRPATGPGSPAATAKAVPGKKKAPGKIAPANIAPGEPNPASEPRTLPAQPGKKVPPVRVPTAQPGGNDAPDRPAAKPVKPSVSPQSSNAVREREAAARQNAAAMQERQREAQVERAREVQKSQAASRPAVDNEARERAMRAQQIQAQQRSAAAQQARPQVPPQARPQVPPQARPQGQVPVGRPGAAVSKDDDDKKKKPQ